MLTDTGGEHQGVEPAKRRRHARDGAAQTVDVDVEREGGVGVAGRRPFDRFAHVGGTRQSEQPGPLRQLRRQLVGRQSQPPLQIEEHSGVDVAGTGGHDKTLQRREAHRSVDRAAVAYGGQRDAGAQVAGDEAQSGHVASHELGNAPERVRVREAVEAVAPEAEAAGPFAGQGVGGRCQGDAGVKGRVEAGDLWGVVEGGAHGGDPQQGLRLVQRGQVDEGREASHDVVVDQDRSRELLSAVHDAVTDSLDPGHVGERVGDGRGVLRAERRRQVARDEYAAVPVDDPELEAARPGVDDKDAHQTVAASAMGDTVSAMPTTTPPRRAPAGGGRRGRRRSHGRWPRCAPAGSRDTSPRSR